MSYQKKTNYMAEFLSEESKEICRKIVEKHELSNISHPRKKGRNIKKR